MGFQSKEISVRDWKDAAHDVAAELASSGLVPSRYPTSSPAVASRPVFVEVARPDSLFLHEAAGELEADILRRGGTITHSPNDATIVSLDVDVVPWSRPLHDSNTEAVLNVAAVVNDKLVMKLVEPVFVRDGDVALYQPPPPMPTRLLRYETDK